MLVDFDEDVFIEQSEVALKKAFDRNLKRIELDVLGCVGDAKKKISVRTFDGFIKDVSKIHGYVHPFFLNAAMLYNPGFETYDPPISSSEYNFERKGFSEDEITKIMDKIGKKDPFGVLAIN